jgi:acyl-CoA reductase-like NAD-dependent aldehyde dehydrogenase
MGLLKQMNGGAYPRPCIAEMGGKNPCIVTRHANLDHAAAGIVRSAYGMGGQKCSALSRLYVDAQVAEALLERLVAAIAAIRIGDPCRREHWLGPVVNEREYASYQGYVDEMRAAGARIFAGGMQLRGAISRAAITSRPRLRNWRPVIACGGTRCSCRSSRCSASAIATRRCDSPTIRTWA